MNWRKSSRSVGQGACVEMAVEGTTHLVRDSKNPNGPMLTFPTTVMMAFLVGLRNDVGHNGTR